MIIYTIAFTIHEILDCTVCFLIKHELKHIIYLLNHLKANAVYFLCLKR